MPRPAVQRLQQHSSKQQREEHFASIIVVSDKGGMKTAIDKVQADTKKHKENLVLLQTMMKDRESSHKEVMQLKIEEAEKQAKELA